MTRITIFLNQLKKLTYGKHIVARVEKLLVAGKAAAAVQQVTLPLPCRCLTWFDACAYMHQACIVLSCCYLHCKFEGHCCLLCVSSIVMYRLRIGLLSCIDCAEGFVQVRMSRATSCLCNHFPCHDQLPVVGFLSMRADLKQSSSHPSLSYSSKMLNPWKQYNHICIMVGAIIHCSN